MANIYELPLPDGSIVQVEGEREPTREEWLRAIGPKFAPSASGGLPMIADEGLLAKARRDSGSSPKAQPPQPFLGETELGRQLEYSAFERQKVENQEAQAARALNQQIENTIGTAGLRIGAPVAATLALVTPGAQPTIPALLSIGASGLLGEQAAQVAEGRNPLEAGNIPEQVAAGLLAPIGVGATSARGLSAIRQGLTEGLTIAGGNEAARAIGANIRGEEYRPDLSTVINFGLGSGLGTIGRAAEARAPAPLPKIEPAPTTAAGDAAQAVSQIKQQGGANAQATLTQLSMGQADAGLREIVPPAVEPSPLDDFVAGATVREIEAEPVGLASMRKLNEEAAAATPRGKAGTLRDLLSAEEAEAIQASIPSQASGITEDAATSGIREFQDVATEPSPIENYIARAKLTEAQKDIVAPKISKAKATPAAKLPPSLSDWYSTSAVRRADNGEPIRMYHGTSADVNFKEFDPAFFDDKALFGPGIYTTASPEVAGGADASIGYAGKGGGSAPRVIPLWVKIERPFNADAFPDSAMSVAEEMDRVASRVFDDNTYLGIDFDAVDRYETFGNVDNGTLFQLLSRAFSSNKKANAQRVIREMGHDGITHTGGLSNKWNPDVKTPHKVAIAFSPEQVKFALAESAPQTPRVDRRQLLRQRAAERGMVRPSSLEAPILPASENAPASSAPPASLPATGGVTTPQAGLEAPPQVRPLSMRERERLGFLDRKFTRTALSEAEEAERRTLRARTRALGEFGFASGPVTSGLSGSAVGGAGGYLSTEQQEGETDEEFNARRLFNTVAAGLGGGATFAAGAEVLGRIKMPKPNKGNPNLPNELLGILNRTEQKTPLGDRLEKLYLSARYNLDSKSSTIRYVQRKLADNVGKSVTFGGVNDLGAAYESLPAAVARAGLWIRSMNDVVTAVPKPARPWMETLVAGRRILNRLEANERANVRLLDELQQAQISLDEARQANANYDKFILDERNARTEFSNSRKALSKDPTPDNWQNYWQAEFEYNQARQARIDNAAVARGLEAAKDRVTTANNAIKEGFDRKKTGGFGLPGEAGKVDIVDQIQKTERAIVDQFGPEVLNTINKQIDLYQGLMRGGLQETVRAGLLSPDAYRRIIADNDFYAPFAVLREIDEEVKRAGPAGKIGGVASSAAVTRAIKGIKDPDFKLDNIFAVSAEQLFNNSIRSENNRFMRRFATLSRQDVNGDYVRRLASDEKPRPGYEVISYMDSGTPRRLEVTPEIARVLGSVDAQNADVVADAIRTGGNVFKLFVTGVNPFFQIPNYLFYDSTRANIFSRYGLGQGPQRYALAPIYMLTDAVPALFSSARANLLGQQDELYKRAIDTGVLSGVFSRYLRPQAFERTLPSNRTATQILKDNRFGVDPIMNYWGRIGAVLEEATKIAGTKRAARWHMVDVPSGSIPGAPALGTNITVTKKIPLGKAEKLMGASAPEVERAWKEAAYDIRNYYGSPDFSVRGAALNAAATYFPFAPAVQRAVIADFQKMFPIGDTVAAMRGRPFDKKRLAEAGAAWGRMLQLFGLPALGVAAVNALPENKQDYDRLPDWAREGNINIPLYETAFPDGTVRSLPYIPAPVRETLGVTQKPAYFSSERVGEPIREYVRIPLQGNFNRAFNTLAASVTSDSANSPDYVDVVDTFLTNSSPVNVSGNTLGERAMSIISSTNPVIRAPFEQAANMNFFTKQPIVDRNKLNASDPLLQFDPERNVALVKGLSEAVPEWVKEAAPALASPQRLEGGIRAMTGNLLDLAKPSTLSPDNPAREANPLLGRFYRSESVDTEATRGMAQQAEGQTVDQNIIDDNTARDYIRVLEDPALTREQKVEYTRRIASEGKLTDGMLSAMDKRLEAKALGLGSDDRIVRGLASAEARARFYQQKLATFGENRQAIAEYLRDQYEKNLFTDAVAEELGKLSQ